MKTLITLFAAALLAGCVTTQPEPVPLTLAEQEQAYKSDVSQMTMPELCREYRSHGSTTYRSRFKNIVGAEIEKRKYWSQLEWDLIQHHRIAVGVSEKLVRCSWGEPKSVDIRTASHEVIRKLMYQKGYVHIHNDIVLAIQPSGGY
jgi:hypothetical protein